MITWRLPRRRRLRPRRRPTARPSPSSRRRRSWPARRPRRGRGLSGRSQPAPAAADRGEPHRGRHPTHGGRQDHRLDRRLRRHRAAGRAGGEGGSGRAEV